MHVGEPFETSDHQQIRWSLVCSRDEINKLVPKLNYFKADFDGMREYVKSRNWETNLVGAVITECWTKLKDKLYLLRDKFVPLSKKVKNESKWVTNRVIKLRRAKTKAWNNYVKGAKIISYMIYTSLN